MHNRKEIQANNNLQEPRYKGDVELLLRCVGYASAHSCRHDDVVEGKINLMFICLLNHSKTGTLNWYKRFAYYVATIDFT